MATSMGPGAPSGQPPSLASVAALTAAACGAWDAGLAAAGLAALCGWVGGCLVTSVGHFPGLSRPAAWLRELPKGLHTAWVGEREFAAQALTLSALTSIGGLALWFLLAGPGASLTSPPRRFAAAALGGLVLGIAGWLRIKERSPALAQPLPGPMVALCVPLLPLLTAGGVLLGSGLYSALPPALRSAALFWPALTLLLWLLLSPRRLPRFVQRGSMPLLILSALLATLAVQRSPTQAARVVGKSWLGAAPVLALRALGDRDGDGHAGWLGGGDCRDDAPEIHPAAYDIPGDGIDSDCSGGDSKVAALELHPRPLEPTPWPAAAPPRPDSLLLISIDALRADRLRPSALAESPMPQLATFAQHSLQVERAYAPSSSTRRSLPALLAQGALPKSLQGAGLRTAAFVNPWTHGHLPQLGRGFERYEPYIEKATPAQRRHMGPITTHRALEFLEQSGAAPFFLWLHYIDPHHPYTPGGEEGSGSQQQRYDRELGSLDRALAPLLQRIQSPAFNDRVVVVVTADHGEEFGEHGGAFHARELYEESVRVPLLIRSPGLPAGVLKGISSLHDLAPTLLDLLGVKSPRAQRFWGQSLLPYALRSAPLPRRPLLLAVQAQDKGLRRALLWWPFKYLERSREGERQLFQLEEDPGERSDSSQRYPEVAARLRASLAAARP